MNLIINYMKVHFKIKMQYKVSFICTVISQIIIVFLEFFVLQSLFNKFSLLDKFNKYELYFNFSAIFFGYSLAQLVGRGFDKFYRLIGNGNFDFLLIRPRNLFIQIIGSEMYYEKISKVISSLIILIYSCTKIINGFNIFKLLLVLSIILGIFIIIISVFIIGASVSFYTIQGIEFINIFTDGTKQLGQYPMGIFNKVIRFIFTFVIPLTLVNYYPLEYLMGRTTFIGYAFLPLLSTLYIIPALLLFKVGLKKYKSSGS